VIRTGEAPRALGLLFAKLGLDAHDAG
jgi:hypothetical protein